ncbi:Universal stress protein [uncultured archaeon]|nr:Universal stress protein [uncultured archaeon]
MFEKVLVPTDFSMYSHKVLECVAAIPGLREVVLVNAIDAGNPMNMEKKGWSYSSLIDEAQGRLEEQADHLAHLGKQSIIVHPILKVIVEPMSGADGVNLQRPSASPHVEMIEGGSIAEAIEKTAAEQKISLIVMGAQGKGLVEGMLLGSVSTGVLRSGLTDLMLIRHKILEGPDAAYENFCRNMFSRVLVTTDFSDPAEEAISLAKELEGAGEIMLVHVVPKGKKIEEAAGKLNLLRETLETPHRKVTVHVLEGHPASEILALAKRGDASMIIMSSLGSGWLKQIRLGSTTFDVARRAEGPVMIVRPHKS